MALYFPRKKIPLPSLKLSLADVKRIYARLSVYVDEQATLELNELKKPADKTDNEFDIEKKNIREKAFKITVTLSGRDGDELYGEDNAVFDFRIDPRRSV